MQTCFKCGVSKDDSAFYAHPQMSSGLLGKCKECARSDSKVHREKNRDRYKEFDRQRNMNPDRVAARKRYLNTEAGRKAKATAERNYMERHPGKRNAQWTLNNAVRDGRIEKRPCERCGVVKVEAHHADYSKPLEVRWLCNKHHREAHKK